jgi:serine phosphatase RsbU (regulator of sigma subunit)
MINRVSILFLFLLLQFLLISQNPKSSVSNYTSILSLKDDSVKIDKLLELSRTNINTDFVFALRISDEALSLATRIKDHKRRIISYNQLGDQHYYKANFQKSFLNYFRAYKLSDSIQDKNRLAWSAYNLGWVAGIQQESYKDVSYLYLSLKLSQELNDDALAVSLYNALGSFYTNKLNKDSLRSNFDSAARYFNKGIELTRKLKLFNRAGVFYLNIGQLFLKSKDVKSAKFYFQKSLEVFKNDSNNAMGSVVKIAHCDMESKQYEDAFKKFSQVYDYCERNDRSSLKLEALQGIVSYYYLTGNYKMAYDKQKIYYALNSKMLEESNAVTASNLETDYNYEKAEVANRELKNITEIQELKNKRKTIYISVLIGIGLVIVIIAYLLFRQNKIKQESNSQLTEQNKIIREKKEEIEQSIQYAKGIQTSFLPDVELLDIFLPNNFIFYQPKDVVSGDFYWFQTSKDKKQILLACADCTGHGVPGALMSMVGINMLQQFCGVEKLHRPNTILKNLNNEIKNSLKQYSDQNKQRDGMDIALIRIDLIENKLVFSAANRSLYILRHKELIELKPTKCAIGGYTPFDQVFEEHEFTLHKGDLIVMTTDGFADQFGGDDGKKYMTKKFKDLLISVNGLSSKDQHAAIQSAFNSWKGNYDQVDDVCVVGINV